MNAFRACSMLAVLVAVAGLSVDPSAASDPQGTQGTPPQTTPLAVSTQERQGDPEPSASVDVTAASKYLFQGFDYSDGKVVLQPNLVASFAGFAGAVWANYQPDPHVVNEIDLSVKYEATVSRLSITPGYMYLAYPNRDWDPSQELFVDFGVKAPLSPSLSLHYDVDAGRGLYATLGVSHELKSLNLGANLFYQGHYYEVTGIPAAELKVSRSWSVGAVSLTPQISHFFTWENGDLREEARVPSTWLFQVNTALPVLF